MRAYDAGQMMSRWEMPAGLPAFVSPAVTGEARLHPAAAILFADVVGFTRLCERLAPEAAFAVLQGFHTRMLLATSFHHAAICDVMGDAVMAVWAGPDGGDNATRALACGFAMRDAMERWADDDDALDEPLKIGVGIHLGPVMVGRTGSALQPKLSAFGDAVNVASRLERLTRRRGATVIASDTLLRAAAAARPCDRGLARFGVLEAADLSGRAAPVRIRCAG